MILSVRYQCCGRYHLCYYSTHTIYLKGVHYAEETVIIVQYFERRGAARCSFTPNYRNYRIYIWSNARSICCLQVW